MVKFDWDYDTDYLRIGNRRRSLTIYKGENVIRCTRGKYSFDIKLYDISYVSFTPPTILTKGFITFYNDDEIINLMGDSSFKVSYRDKSRGDFLFIVKAIKDAGVKYTYF